MSKQAAATEALNFLSSGQYVGIGSGTTIHWLISLLPETKISNLFLVPSSLDTLVRLQNNIKQNYKIVDLPPHGLDITIDGADKVNPEKQSVKGGGGALTREKIIREASKKFILIVSSEKVVPKLPMFPIAVEILPFGWRHTIKRLELFGKKAILRIAKNKLGPVISDNNGYIVDLDLGDRFLEPNEVQTLEDKLNTIPGVIENGLFGHAADEVIVGHNSGNITRY
ncbi:MAG: ribose 5-phosphate isomerase A [Promethearchaeota archaeon]